ncbi:hypothetical protein LCGC14_1667480 [marine sediment metagenome]|uniref:Uncharacterized protein n=1 Tax=marine sediment metagenome TaxID=412755 RepID=A0A0F9HSZ3_9ZZZZ
MEKTNKCKYIKNCSYYLHNPEMMNKTKCVRQEHIECHYYIYMRRFLDA